MQKAQNPYQNNNWFETNKTEEERSHNFLENLILYFSNHKRDLTYGSGTKELRIHDLSSNFIGILQRICVNFRLKTYEYSKKERTKPFSLYSKE